MWDNISSGDNPEGISAFICILIMPKRMVSFSSIGLMGNAGRLRRSREVTRIFLRAHFESVGRGMPVVPAFCQMVVKDLHVQPETGPAAQANGLLVHVKPLFFQCLVE
jgi:hypothetical protein